MNFSDWMRGASPQDKETLFKRIMRDVEAEQKAQLRQARNGQDTQAWNASEQEADGAVEAAKSQDVGRG